MVFSVIIPLYNKQEHIKRAIDSVLKQTYQDFEVIVIDDGSTDLGVNIVNEIVDLRIRLIKQTNKGVSIARNVGISNALFDNIALLDADDFWRPNFLESIYKLMNEFPKSGAYATSYEFVRENGTVESPKLNIKLDKGETVILDYFKNTLQDPIISASSVVIPKHVFNSIGGFPKDLTRGEDLEMWCRIALNYKIAYINKVCATYFQNSENRSISRKSVLSESFANCAEEILEKQKEVGNNSFYFEEYIIKILISKARYLIKSKQNKQARKLLFKYRYSKYNKRTMIKTYLSSFVLLDFLNNLKKRIIR